MSQAVEPPADDAPLIQRCQDGDTAAFDVLVLRHQRQAFAVAWRLLGDADEAKDVAQEAFVRAWRAIGTFRGDAKFSTWLLTIVTNLCRNRRRWWARRKQLIVASLDDPGESDDAPLADRIADPAPTPADRAVHSELGRQVAAALGRLDQMSRAVVVLRDVEGLPYEEIAGVLDCRVGTVKSRLNRARRRLQTLLQGTL